LPAVAALGLVGLASAALWLLVAVTERRARAGR
jgi:hypothetical protein